VLARLQRRNDGRGVDLVGRADIDGVDFLQLEQLVKIGEDLGNFEISASGTASQPGLRCAPRAIPPVPMMPTFSVFFIKEKMRF
jgi:hypothetical protein